MTRYDRIDNFISVPADSWIAALQGHAAFLAEVPHSQPPAPVVNGHACALALLSILTLDALAGRAAYMIREYGGAAALVGTTPLRTHPRRIVDFLVDLIAERGPTSPSPDAVREIYVLRGVLAHNYLWIVDFAESDDPPAFDVLGATLAEGFGDEQFRRTIDGHHSRALRLNLIPTLVDRRDAGKVLEVCWETVNFLGSVRGASIALHAVRRIKVGNKLMTLGEAAELLLK